MPEKLSARVGKLEESERRAWKAIEALAGNQKKLDDALVVLLEAQTKTETRFQKTSAQIASLGASLDERIAKLVSAIGELLRRNGAK